MKDMFLIMDHQYIQLNASFSTYKTACVCHASLSLLISVPPSSGVLTATTASLVALWVATVTVFGVVTAVLSWQSFKLKQKSILGHMDDIDMTVSTCTCQVLAGSPFLFQCPNNAAPPNPPLPLLFPPKALTTSSSNQIPATVQWRGPISDNAIAACLSGCTYVRTLVRETIQSCIKFFSLYLSCYL